jgi:hypothetical protein
MSAEQKRSASTDQNIFYCRVCSERLRVENGPVLFLFSGPDCSQSSGFRGRIVPIHGINRGVGPKCLTSHRPIWHGATMDRRLSEASR